MADILAVRHGQSIWNAVGRWQGQADPPLSGQGRDQARAAAGAAPPVDLVAASDLVRARVTAETIAEVTGVGPVQLAPGFRERHAGAWQGRTRAEIHQAWPGALPDDPRRGGPPGDGGPVHHPEGWEPDDALLARVLGALRPLVEEVGDGRLLVVTHGGVIYALEAHLGQPHQRIANLTGRWFRAEPVTDGALALALGARQDLLGEGEATVPTGI